MACFKGVLRCLTSLLDRISFRSLKHEFNNSNLGAHLVASSVTREDCRQSYVATGYLI